ncbi:hypothetical protein BJ742DRAFT_791319 [Cladochytrium replicatum]|nr:hypothetical protein BJ742DRAFT_791319 [Cladochytrium replicatum]
MNKASPSVYLEILEWWKEAGFKLTPHDISPALGSAKANGHVKMLDWWKSNCSRRDLKGSIMDGASRRVLNGLGSECSTDAMDSASSTGHIHVLDWWRKPAMSKF